MTPSPHPRRCSLLNEFSDYGDYEDDVNETEAMYASPGLIRMISVPLDNRASFANALKAEHNKEQPTTIPEHRRSSIVSRVSSVREYENEINQPFQSKF